MDQPTEFGPYLLLERISLGGMAEVFKAVEFGVEGFERTVAVKRILPHVAEDEEFIAMFKDEAHIAVQLTHSNIAQIYNLGHEQDSFYIALEYVAGRDVRTLFEYTRKRGEPMPAAQACYVVMQVCEGLDYAHNKKDKYGRSLNIIHRDVSPPNVLVSYEGEVKLIDFGVAKAAGRASQTQAGILKGKFGYMSPEQVKGMALDRRSDVFALGVVLWEMLTARRLFQGETDFATLEKVRAVDVEAPSLYNPEIPPELEQIVFKVLAADPDQRYQSATELHDDLQAFMFAKGLFYSRKDLAAWMRQVYAREIELEKEKANERAAQVAASRGGRGASGGGPPPPPGRAGPPKPPGKKPGGGGRKRAKTMVMATAKPDIPGQKGPPAPPGRAVSGAKAKPAPPRPKPAPPKPKSKAPVPKPASPKPKASAPMAAGGGEFDWDDDELETRLFGDEGQDDTSTLPIAGAAAPSAAPSPPPPAASMPAASAPAASMPAASAPAASMPAASMPAASMPAQAPPVATSYEPVPAKNNNTVVIVAIIAALLVVGLVGALYFLRQPSGTKDEAAVADGAAAQAAVGSISLTLTPADAQVSVDGKPVPGSGSPRVVADLAPGTHQLEVSKGDGFLPYAQEVTVMAGSSQQIPVALQLSNVTLDVKVDPEDAKLALVAGDEKTPIESKHALTRKAGVDYKVHASKDGYADATVPVVFNGQATQAVTIALVSEGGDEAEASSKKKRPRAKKKRHTPAAKPKNATLVIGVKPGLPPADIYVDNKKVGRGVVTYKVSSGGHTVKWKWGNGKSDSQKVSVGANEKKKLRGAF